MSMTGLDFLTTPAWPLPWDFFLFCLIWASTIGVAFVIGWLSAKGW